jgi:hypothetical protein
MSSDEFKEIESDVFRATRSGVVAGFHGCLSEGVARSDGSGSMEVGATWTWQRAAQSHRNSNTTATKPCSGMWTRLIL